MREVWTTANAHVHLSGSLQNCVSGGAPLTGGFDSHAPSPIKARNYCGKEETGRLLPRFPSIRRFQLRLSVLNI
jgi:hypothetical protein